MLFFLAASVGVLRVFSCLLFFVHPIFFLSHFKSLYCGQNSFKLKCDVSNVSKFIWVGSILGS